MSNELQKRTFRFKEHFIVEPPRRKITTEEVLERLDGAQPTGTAGQWVALCPAHADTAPSLSVGQGENSSTVLKCHAGCAFPDICNKLGLQPWQLMGDALSDDDDANDEEDGADDDQDKERSDDEQDEVDEDEAIEWGELSEAYENEITDKQVDALAEELHVSPESLRAMGIGWLGEEDAFTFPEVDAHGKVIGIARRFADGAKRTIPGSARGLCMPKPQPSSPPPNAILVVEGPSDAAAARTMGLDVIGRPSATGGLKHLSELFKDTPLDQEIIIVGEYDPKPDGKWPGREAAENMAQKLADALEREIKWALPPKDCKDTRDYLAKTELEPEEAGKAYLEALLRVAKTVKPQARGLEFVPAYDLLRQNLKSEWIVKNILAKGQPAVFGGPKKVLKSSLAMDLAYALSSGGKFLGHFDVPRPFRVMLINGESGPQTVQATIKRIDFARQPFGKPSDAETRKALQNLHVGFTLPSFSKAEDITALMSHVDRLKADVVIIDPLYLCLLAQNKTASASNLYDIGPLLSGVASQCVDRDVTLILLHHFTKHKGKPTSGPPELDDLAFAGISEFARQWLLIGRSQEYDPETGKHQLWMNIGGSVGHSGSYVIDVDEGVLKDDFSGRRWQTTVRRASEVVKEKEKEKEKAKRVQTNGDMDLIEKYIQENGPDTQSGIVDNTPLSKGRVASALPHLLSQGRVVKTQVEKAAGAVGTRKLRGYGIPGRDEKLIEEETEDEVEANEEDGGANEEGEED